MNWADFLFGVGVGALLLFAIEVAVLGTIILFDTIFTRLKKLEDERGRE